MKAKKYRSIDAGDTWEEEVEKEVFDLMRHPLMTWWQMYWKEGANHVGPPDLSIRAAFKNAPCDNAFENILYGLRKLANRHYIEVGFYYCQDEDQDGDICFWDSEETYSPW